MKPDNSRKNGTAGEKQAPPTEEPGLEAAPRAVPEAEKKAADYYDQLVRLKAEFENYRKRVEREKPELVRWGKAELLLKLIPLYDVLLHAHAHVNSIMSRDKAACSGPTEELCKGLEITFREFSKVFESEGIKVMETIGRPYDPMLHEVMGTVESDNSQDGTVVEELQRGFTVEGKILRPARVRIAKNKESCGDAGKK